MCPGTTGDTVFQEQRRLHQGRCGEAGARLSADEALTRLEGALLISLSGDDEANEP